MKEGRKNDRILALIFPVKGLSKSVIVLALNIFLPML
jgi:hypothetical protein